MGLTYRFATGLAAAAFVGIAVRAAQESPPTVQSTPDTPATAIVERYRSAMMVDADGRFTQVGDVRIRVLTDEAVREHGTIALPYARHQGTLTVHSIRVHKPGGNVVETPVDNGIDVPAPVTRAAPSYTDLVERHVNVRGLSAGDLLEYAFSLELRPLVAGHVFYEDEWMLGQVVVDGEVTLSAPADMYLNVKTRGDQPTVETTNGRRVHRWKFVRTRPFADRDFAALIRERRTERARVQLTSFRSWDDVATVVRGLWNDRAAVTPAIEAKARELTQGLQREDDRIQAIHSFVSDKVRYVSVSLGVGRIQPHAAAEVLANGFGDCKDKHVLLQAMLRAIGLEAEPVLISPGLGFDRDVPSLAQFSHVVTAVKRTGGATTWIDATIPAAPSGFLSPVSRDHLALRIPRTGSAEIVTTPAASVRPNTMAVALEGRVDENGALQATVTETFSGDSEVILRAALRSLSESDRLELVKRLSFRDLGGTFADPSVAGIDGVGEAVTVRYRFTKTGAVDWAGKRLTVPLPALAVEEMAEDLAIEPLELIDDEHRLVARIELPRGFGAAFAANKSSDGVAASADSGTYRRTMSVEGNLLRVERQLATKRGEVPESARATYSAFRSAVTASAPVLTLTERWPWNSVSRVRFDFPAGSHARANELVAEAKRLGGAASIALLNQAVELDPKHPEAWALLGDRQYAAGNPREGEDSRRRQLAVAPSAAAVKKLADIGTIEEVIAVYRDASTRFPDDRDIPALLGELLVRDGQNREAIEIIAGEIAQRPRSSRLHVSLGRAYMRLGEIEKGMAAFRRSIALENGPNIWSLFAAELAERNHDLDTALEYGRKAVAFVESETKNTTDLGRLPAGTADAAGRMAGYTRTMGRIWIARGDLDQAERYCQASWALTSYAPATDCLADIAEKRQDYDKASRFREYTAYVRGQLDISRPEIRRRAEELSAERLARLTHTVPREGDVAGSGEVHLIVDARGVVRQARMMPAADNLASVAATLAGKNIGPDIPDQTETKLRRRGRLTCETASPNCSLQVFAESVAGWF